MPGVGAKPATDHETPVAEEDLGALRIGDREVALVKRAMLIEEPVIRGDQDVREVGRGQLADELGQILDRILCRLGQLVFGLQLVADRVDPVVVDVDDVVVAEERLCRRRCACSSHLRPSAPWR